MEIKFLYVLIFLSLYLGYSVFISYRESKIYSSTVKFKNSSKINEILFIFTAAAFSFCGWLFIVHPALIFRDGFSYSYLGLIAILIPLSGILFLKKLWIIRKVYKLESLEQILNYYFKSKNIKFLCTIISFFFCVPFLGVSILVSGKIFDYLTNGEIDFYLGCLVSTFILYYYLYFERNRSISIISVLQFFLFILGISILGFYILNQIGGITEFSNLLKKLSLIDNLRWDSSKQETASPLFVVPELFRMGSSLHNSYPQGGIWTVSMIFSSSIVFLGIQTSPSFTMFAINKGNPNLFARYQLYVSGIILGFIILVLPVIIGFGSHFLGANHIINSQKLNISNLLPESLSLVGEGNLILEIVKSISLDFSLGLGFFLLCLIASIHSTSALFINFSIKSFLNGFNSTNSNEKKRSLTYKFILTLIFIFTLILIIFFENFLLSIGSIAMSLSLQLLVALLSICYFPFMNKKGVIIGAIVGMIVVVLTEQITVMLLGEYLPWGKWPLYISSGLWGLMFNIIFSIFFSLIFQNKIDKEFRINFHKKINEFDGNTEKNNLINLIIALCLIFVWMFFSLGPLNLFGNAIFGNPKVIESWIFGFPSIWLWQFLSWFFGVIIIWIIAYKLKFSVIKNNYDSFGR